MSGSVQARRQRRTTSNRTEALSHARRPTCWLGCFSGGRHEGSEDGGNQDSKTQSLVTRGEESRATCREKPACSESRTNVGSGRGGGGDDGTAAQGNMRNTAPSYPAGGPSIPPSAATVQQGILSLVGGHLTAAARSTSGNTGNKGGQEVYHTEVYQLHSQPAPTAVPSTAANSGTAPETNMLRFQAVALPPRAIQQVSQFDIQSDGIFAWSCGQSGQSAAQVQALGVNPNNMGAASPSPEVLLRSQPNPMVPEIEALPGGPQPPVPNIHRALGRPVPQQHIGFPANHEPLRARMRGLRSMEEVMSLSLTTSTGKSSISGCGFTASSDKGNDLSAESTAGKGSPATSAKGGTGRGLRGDDSAAGGCVPHGDKIQAQGSPHDVDRHPNSEVHVVVLDKSLLTYVKLREKSLLHAAFGSAAQAVAATEHRDLQMSSAARYCDPGAMRYHPASMLERVVGRAVADLRSRGRLDRHSVKLIRHIGSGAFGSVYFGLWQGFPVAVKVLLLEDDQTQPGLLRQHRAMLEAAIGSTLDHPNVAATYAYDCLMLSSAEGENSDPKGAVEGGGGAGSAGGRVNCQPKTGAAGTAQDVPNAQQHKQTQQGLSGSTVGDAAVHKLYIVQEFCSGGSLKEMLTALSTGLPAAGEQGQAGSSFGLLTGGVLGGGAAAAAALSFAFDVACGLRHVHAARVVHGDISCGNVLFAFRQFEHKPPAAAAEGSPGGTGVPSSQSAVRQSAVPADEAVRGVDETEQRWRRRLAELPYRPPPLIAKVADFGLSMWLNGSRSHASGLYQGTPLYVAPEVYGWGRVSRASDVYSYGVLLLELVYGKTVSAIWQDYHQRQYQRLLRKGVGTDIMLPALDVAALGGHGLGSSPLLNMLRTTLLYEPTCPIALRELVTVCLAVCPSHRPSFDQIAAELVNIMEGLVV